MASFPFTNHSPTVGADTRLDRGRDPVHRHQRPRTAYASTSACNGTATGTAWFDDVAVEEVADVSRLRRRPRRCAGSAPAYRYDDRGWIFVHVEGEPYQRGYQYGALLADEIAAYATKLGIQENHDDSAGRLAHAMRFQADALFLRGYDEEYLARDEGASPTAPRTPARSSTASRSTSSTSSRSTRRSTSASSGGALSVTPARALRPQLPHGRGRGDDPDERTHKCSSFAATGPATADGRVVFGQIFMWGGYTGVHWNVLADVVPSARATGSSTRRSRAASTRAPTSTSTPPAS